MENDLQAFYNDLVRAIGPGLSVVQEPRILTVRADYQFEPFGKASESFELVWTLDIPEVCFYWHSTKGWVRGNLDVKGMTFEGASLTEAISRGYAWLHTMQNQGLRPEWFGAEQKRLSDASDSVPLYS